MALWGRQGSVARLPVVGNLVQATLAKRKHRDSMLRNPAVGDVWANRDGKRFFVRHADHEKIELSELLDNRYRHTTVMDIPYVDYDELDCIAVRGGDWVNFSKAQFMHFDCSGAEYSEEAGADNKVPFGTALVRPIPREGQHIFGYRESAEYNRVIRSHWSVAELTGDSVRLRYEQMVIFRLGSNGYESAHGGVGGDPFISLRLGSEEWRDFKARL